MGLLRTKKEDNSFNNLRQSQFHNSHGRNLVQYKETESEIEVDNNVCFLEEVGNKIN